MKNVCHFKKLLKKKEKKKTRQKCPYYIYQKIYKKKLEMKN